MDKFGPNSRCQAFQAPQAFQKASQRMYGAPHHGPAPMDLDSTATRKFKPLTDAEKKHRRENNLCLYCGKAGHMAAQCNLKNNNPRNSRPPARIQATILPEGDFELSKNAEA